MKDEVARVTDKVEMGIGTSGREVVCVKGSDRDLDGWW